MRICPGRALRFQAQQEQDRHAYEAEDYRHEGPGEYNGCQQFAREDDDLWADDGSEDTAGEHEGDGARLEFGGALSAAAKRYCCTKASPRPMVSNPKANSQKLAGR